MMHSILLLLLISLKWYILHRIQIKSSHFKTVRHIFNIVMKCKKYNSFVHICSLVLVSNRSCHTPDDSGTNAAVCVLLSSLLQVRMINQV